MSDCRNEFEIQFIGLQRSGNHAILSWLFQQFDEPVYFFNNVKHFGNPIREFQPLDLPNAVRVRRGSSPGRIRQLEEIGRRRKKALIYSYENLRIRDLPLKTLVQDKETVLGKSKHFRRIMIVRDFFNWLASRIRYQENLQQDDLSANQIDRYIRLWIMYAKEYLGESRYTRDVEVVPVCYNHWVKEEAYRQQLLNRIGLAMRDNSNFYVSDAGGGSSFDATTFSGRSSGMRVFERCLYLKESKFRHIIPALLERYPNVEGWNEKILAGEEAISPRL